MMRAIGQSRGRDLRRRQNPLREKSEDDQHRDFESVMGQATHSGECIATADKFP